LLPVANDKVLGTGDGLVSIIYFYEVSFNITQQLVKKLTNTRNSTHVNLSKEIATFKARCNHANSIFQQNFDSILKPALIFLKVQ